MYFSKYKEKMLQFLHRSHADHFDPIVFVNSPIEDEKSDIIGLNSKADAIDEAIRCNARIIGIVGKYGSGKSSLIRLLAQNKNKYKKVITVNLWDTLETVPMGTGDCVTDLTKSFVFQIAAGLSDPAARYVNRRLNKNYDVLSFGVESRLQHSICR